MALQGRLNMFATKLTINLMKMMCNMKLSGRAWIVRVSFFAAVFSLFFSTISPEVVQGQTQGQQMQGMQPQVQIFPVEQEIYKVKQKLDKIFIPEKEEFLSKLYRIPFPSDSENNFYLCRIYPIILCQILSNSWF
jgi:hypothetical protein